ncbi:MAG: UvrD-helicase domain-containing protein [Oscillospiraceae bacterium]|nr:UvrD-helicase domain-containing protein [Oscillospiraceae bacterium]
MPDFEKEFLQLKKAVIDKEFSRLNPVQRQAVYHTDGPLLILAGAGSGKTTVIVSRIANLVRFGSAYNSDRIPYSLTEDDLDFLRSYSHNNADEESMQYMENLLAVNPVNPWNILAITFTNKAANELQERLVTLLGNSGRDVCASTFHSACVRILRREISVLGYNSDFTIYDTDDSLRIIKECMKKLNIDDKSLPPRSVLSAISRNKDSLGGVEELEKAGAKDYRVAQIAKIYDGYQKTLRSSNAVDFDDIIALTVKLFSEHPDVLEKYRKRFRYIMVDEYQDTNHAQYLLVSLLAGGHHNLCVVGDDDQSIYKFRGATIENILSFEKQFDDAKVIRLEQNYRSTSTILDAANKVIANNTERKGKNLWTSNEKGEKIKVYCSEDESGEAEFIAKTIRKNVMNGASYKDHAVLYRMNAQSANLERAFIKHSIPHRIVKGQSFFDRKEIRDIIAYLSVVNNPNDALRMERIINEPKRGIGPATISAATEIANTLGLSLFEVLSHSDEYTALERKTNVLSSFTKMIAELAEMAENSPVSEVYDAVLERSGYIVALEKEGPEGIDRIENVAELKSFILKYEENADEPSLTGFLEESALFSDIDRLDDDDSVLLMTLHSAKGLEFPTVFIAGAEEGIFPGMSAAFNPSELEEERRLAYVGITRARKHLCITHANSRMIFGRTSRNHRSRFIEEIPEELLEIDNPFRRSRPALESAPRQHREFGSAAGRDIGISGRRDASKPGRPAAAPSGDSYSAGDMVNHKVFGNGMVISCVPVGNDHLLEISFDTVGTKKIMANFAKLKKL